MEISKTENERMVRLELKDGPSEGVMEFTKNLSGWGLTKKSYSLDNPENQEFLCKMVCIEDEYLKKLNKSLAARLNAKVVTRFSDYAVLKMGEPEELGLEIMLSKNNRKWKVHTIQLVQLESSYFDFQELKLAMDKVSHYIEKFEREFDAWDKEGQVG